MLFIGKRFENACINNFIFIIFIQTLNFGRTSFLSIFQNRLSEIFRRRTIFFSIFIIKSEIKIKLVVYPTFYLTFFQEHRVEKWLKTKFMKLLWKGSLKFDPQFLKKY